jgi:hypothetical protein
MKTKLFSRGLIAGASMLLMVPAAAMAHEGCHEWHRHASWRERDIARDRYQLQRDLAYGNWRAARAERADIERDEWNLHRDRFVQYPYYQRYGY